MKLVIWHRVSVRVGWYLTSPILPFPLQATSGFRRQPLGLVPFPRFPFPYPPSLLHRVSSRCRLIPQSSSVWSSSSLSLSSDFLGGVLKARRIAYAASQVFESKNLQELVWLLQLVFLGCSKAQLFCPGFRCFRLWAVLVTRSWVPLSTFLYSSDSRFPNFAAAQATRTGNPSGSPLSEGKPRCSAST